MSTQEQVTPTPLPQAEQIIQKIADLQERLQLAAPGYEHLLMTIHKALHDDEEVVHLLSEENIGTIIAALAKKKNVVIIEASRKGQGKTTSGKKLSATTLDDI